MMEKPIYMVKILLFYWTTTIRTLLRVFFRNKVTTPTKERCGVHYFYKLIVVYGYHGVVTRCQR